VRAGFMAAYEQEKEGVTVKIVMTTDIPKKSYRATPMRWPIAMS